MSFEGAHYSFDDLRILPKPAHEVPIWVGGGVEAAYRRGVRAGDGFQLIGLTPEETGAPIARLRGERPEAEFVISLRTEWDPEGMEHDRIRREYDAYADAGVQHVVTAPWRSDNRVSPSSRASFAPRWNPSPSHVGHHPSGLLNE